MKKVSAFIIAFTFLLFCSGCNRRLIDTTYNFDYAYIHLPDGRVIEGEIDSWRDYDNSDQLQVVIDGVTYLTHASNIVMIHGEP